MDPGHAAKNGEVESTLLSGKRETVRLTLLYYGNYSNRRFSADDVIYSRLVKPLSKLMLAAINVIFFSACVTSMDA